MKKLFRKCCALICAAVMLSFPEEHGICFRSISIAPALEVPFAAVDIPAPGIDPLSAGSGYNQETMTYTR